MNKLQKGIALTLVLILISFCIPQSVFAEPLYLEAKDSEGKTWRVETPSSSPLALNGADELRVEKNADGDYIAQLFKNGNETSSNGLIWIYQPIPAGVTAKKIKVDGVEITFSVVGNTWKYAAEFTSEEAKIARLKEVYTIGYTGTDEEGTALYYVTDEDVSIGIFVIVSSDEQEAIILAGPITENGDQLTINDEESGDSLTFTVEEVESGIRLTFEDGSTTILIPTPAHEVIDTIKEIFDEYDIYI